MKVIVNIDLIRKGDAFFKSREQLHDTEWELIWARHTPDGTQAELKPHCTKAVAFWKWDSSMMLIRADLSIVRTLNT